MPEPDPAGSPPPPATPPPAPPTTGEPAHGPDPRDPGPPITVTLGGCVLGDLGHPRVDARLLQALLLRGGEVARWLESRGLDDAAVGSKFPETGWPLQPDGS